MCTFCRNWNGTSGCFYLPSQLLSRSCSAVKPLAFFWLAGIKIYKTIEAMLPRMQCVYKSFSIQNDASHSSCARSVPAKMNEVRDKKLTTKTEMCQSKMYLQVLANKTVLLMDGPSSQNLQINPVCSLQMSKFHKKSALIKC